MLELFNFCPVHGYTQDLESKGLSIEEFAKEIDVDGVEMFVYDKIPDSQKYSAATIGAHLKYWPYWLAFWREDEKRLAKEFPNLQEKIKYYGSSNKEGWLNVIRSNILAALEFQPKYLVWHVSESDEEELYTLDFKYSDDDVINGTIEVFNEVSDIIPDDVCVLFENLWWPGLRMTDIEQPKKMFGGKLKHKNVGVMFDLGHFASTNHELKNQKDIVDYFEQTYKMLGEYGKFIKGFHLSCSLSGEYFKKFDRKKPEDLNMKKIYDHITQIDQHRPFTDDALKRIINLAKPEFLVHELFYKDLDDLSEKISLQKSSLK